MIEQARKLPTGAPITADICIVGGGAAGIAIARELANSARRIVLLAGGDRRERDADRDFYRGEVAPGTSHEPLEEGRRRAWGGTTSAWSGRCVPLDPIDLECRPWVPNSGWPIDYVELQPYFERANEVCEAGRFRYDTREAFPHSQPEMIAGFDGPEMLTSRLERFSPPTNFARRYGPALEKATEVRVLLGAHAVALDLSDNRTRIARLRAKSSTGADLSVLADTYVLACGGLENARLLLASHDQCADGIGNDHDNVGRYYMAHLYGILGWIELRAPDDGFVYGYERDDEGVYCRRRFWITPEAQTQHESGNCIAQLARTDVSDPDHGSALLSAKHLAGTYVDALRDRRPGRRSSNWRAERSQRRAHWGVVARGAPFLIPEVTTSVHRRYFARRQLPGVLGPQSANRFPLLYQAEHLPHRSSRVELATTRDAFGMPRLRTRVAFTDDDVRTVETFHRVLAAQLCATGTGTFHPYVGDLRAQIEARLAAFHSSYHHIGTTRMSASPSDGVVDRNCRVYGVENLFVAGSSVFPTGGHANPTLTLVALALRLADHLRVRR
jgi:choline dehydrogenase-like flavoprotein